MKILLAILTLLITIVLMGVMGGFMYKVVKIENNYPNTLPPSYAMLTGEETVYSPNYILRTTDKTLKAKHELEEILSNKLKEKEAEELKIKEEIELKAKQDAEEKAKEEAEKIKEESVSQGTLNGATIKLSDTSINGGEIVVIRVSDLPDGMTLKAENDFNFKPTFFDVDGVQTALLPVHYKNGVGQYNLSITIGDKKQDYKISLVDKKWSTQNLIVNESVSNDTIYNNDANVKWEQAINPLKMVNDKEKHWQGVFNPPCEARITTEFGTIRYTNGAPTSERHGGIDIAADLGTPVLAPNNGRVLYADFLQLTGNTILIEHGLGLKTYYYHMNSLNVKAGDMVTKGQKIGEVGSTGFSTGAHLHYAMSVNNVFVNPNTAYKTDFIG